MKNTLLILGAIAIIGVSGFLFGQEPDTEILDQLKEAGFELKGANPNMQARLLSTATSSVGHQQDRTLFTAKDYCSNRVISTKGTEISLSFKSSSLNPTATVGHLQGASTTVAYDSALYGCGEIVAAASATTTVTVAEFVY